MTPARDYMYLTWQERKALREQYVKDQNEQCYCCHGSLYKTPKIDKNIRWELFPKNFLKYPAHLHHSHETGLTLGAVHSYCNAVLWQYEGE